MLESPIERPTPRTVGLVLFPGCQPAGLFAVADILDALNFKLGGKLFELRWVGAGVQEVQTWQSQFLDPAASIAEVHADIWLVPALWATDPEQLARVLQGAKDVVSALRETPESSEVWTYCSGALILGATGLLEGRKATSTWWLEPYLKSLHPGVEWRLSESVVHDGRFLSASGVHGYFALLARWVGGNLGPQVVRELEKMMLFPKSHRESGAFRPVDPAELHDPRLRRVVGDAMSLGADSVDLDWAATLLGISPRSLSRFVRDKTGLSAGDWLRRINLRQVGEDLAKTDHSVKQIAEQRGYSSVASLQRSFHQVTGYTPSQYRRHFSEGAHTARDLC
ncbi:MAG: helix-turn-helix domain-containing protein [Fibrobacterota bacterium]